MSEKTLTVGRDWWWPGNWPPGEGCRGLLHLLVLGWKVPPEHAHPFLGEEHRAFVRRACFWNTKYLGRRLPAVPGGGTLRYTDDRAAWEAAGIGEAAIDKYFPETMGRPRLHRHITPAVVKRVVGEVGDALEHLQALPVEALGDHFTDVYGESWPPHLQEVHELLADRWSGGYRGDGTNLRVAMKVPLGASVELGPEREADVVTFRYCELAYDQLRPMRYQ